MLNCREASHLLSDALDRALRREEEGRLAQHLKICPNCQNCRRHFLALRSWKTAFLAGAQAAPDATP
ncbi:MAG: zf-HC2 domain-containing protein [Gammaproteobacteria bacterium]